MLEGQHVEVRRQLQESVFSFHHGGPRDQIQVLRLKGRYLYLLSHLTSPIFVLRQTESLTQPGLKL